MAGTRKSSKPVRKDQSGTREVRRDVEQEIRPAGNKPLIRQPNRDHARGDRDRTGDHRDGGASRAPEDEEPA